MVKSPCVEVCRMDTTKDICVGCWRTLDEIARWRDMSDAEREASEHHPDGKGNTNCAGRDPAMLLIYGPRNHLYLRSVNDRWRGYTVERRY